MTKKFSNAPTDNNSLDDEACRRVLISLYGSEAEAIAVADAMLRKMTAEEEALIDKLYDAGDEVARQIASDAGAVTEPERLTVSDEQVSAFSTEQKDKKLAAYMEEIYRRAAEADEKSRDSGSNALRAAMHGLVVMWRGLLSDMLLLQVNPEMGLARLSTQETSALASYERQSFGFGKALSEIFDDATLRRELSWADGSLDIECEQTQDGSINLIRATVGRSMRRSKKSSPIVLKFLDRQGAAATLELKPGQGSASVENSSLRGAAADIEVAVFIHADG